MPKLEDRIKSTQEIINGLSKYNDLPNLKPMIDHAYIELEFLQELQKLRIVVKYFQQEGGQPARDIIKNLMKDG